MRNNLKVTFNLDHLNCYDEADGWGSAEPYMWTVFFKIDGTTCRLNDSLMLEGTATVYTTPGSHGNLGNTDVDEGDVVAVPGAIGFQEMTLTPIPVPDFVKQLGTDDAPAIAGCIVVLMEEDNISDDGAESGHQALNAAVQNALNSLIPTLGVSNQSISDDDINNMSAQIQSKIEDAVKNQQNFFENIWSWLNPDDTIGSVVWKFSGDDLLNDTSIALQQRWNNGDGDWELFGSVTTAEIPTCPANVVKEIFDALFGGSSSKKSMEVLHHFRDRDMKKYTGLNLWWTLASRNSHFLVQALKNKEVAEAAITLFKEAPAILSNRDKAISEHHFNCATKVLEHIVTLNTKERQSRKDIKRSIDALHLLKGKSPNQLFEALSSVQPARYPSVNALGGSFKLKVTKVKSTTAPRKKRSDC